MLSLHNWKETAVMQLVGCCVFWRLKQTPLTATAIAAPPATAATGARGLSLVHTDGAALLEAAATATGHVSRKQRHGSRQVVCARGRSLHF
jgi:hypothetical protein